MFLDTVNPAILQDAYKIGHVFQYPEGTEMVYSNLTARKSRVAGVEHIVFFGLEYMLVDYLKESWGKNFFGKSCEEVVVDYESHVAEMGLPINAQHLRDLHDLGYLPLEIRAVDEGTRIPIGMPCFTIHNTLPEFFWLTNYLETMISSILWQSITSATIAAEYNRIFTDAMERSGGPLDFVPWMGHDFSYRGMPGTEAAVLSGAGHLISFNGTDTVPAIKFVKRYYPTKETNFLIGASVVASEHSVMCMGGDGDNEYETFRRFLVDVYPKGIVSIVSDTWDYFNVLTNILPRLKDIILSRDGKLVLRPDSGDPELIISLDPNAPDGSPERLGTFNILWNLFGGTINEKGFKMLDPHIGCIYGDSITLERAQSICNNLISQGFVPSMVFGIGSYTYTYVTRDTFGMALKATYGRVNGEGRNIYKDPKTDNGTKKSAKGLLGLYRMADGSVRFAQEMDYNTWLENGPNELGEESMLKTRFLNGKIVNGSPDFADVRRRARDETL